MQFLPGDNTGTKMMSEAEFRALMPKLRPWSDFLYFHLMGEPLLHPQLERFLQIAGEAGFRVILTTNGTLLERQKSCSSPPRAAQSQHLPAFL